jgi:hypothetical protein
MNMPRILLAFGVLSAMGVACTSEGTKPLGLPPSTLVYSDQAHIATLDLATGQRRILLTRPSQSPGNIRGFGTIALVNDTSAIVESCGVLPPCELMLLDLIHGGARVVATGRSSPGVIDEHFLLAYQADSSGHAGLFFESIEHLDDRVRVAGSAPPFKFPSGAAANREVSPVFVGNGRAVFIGEDGWLWLFDRSVGPSRLPSTQEYTPLAWRSRGNELISADYGSGKLVAVNLGTGERRDLFNTTIMVAVYVEADDALLYVKPRLSLQGEIHDLYLYEFRNGSSRRIARDISMYSGVVVPSRG